MYTPVIDPGTVSAVRTAFQRARSGNRNWKAHQQVGRLDARQVWRSDASRDRDIFRDRVAPSATKVNCYVLVDGSGSMTYPVEPIEGIAAWNQPKHLKRKIQAATDVAATMEHAFRTITNVRLNVWLHNIEIDQREGDINMVEVIKNGKGREYLGRMPELAGNGNGDGYAIKFLTDRMVKDTRPDEVALLIVISDGLPSYIAPSAGIFSDGKAATAKEDLVFQVVNAARDRGVRVLSVAVEPIPAQVTMYGKDNVLPFDSKNPNAWRDLAINFGTALGDTLAAAAKAKAAGRRR